MFSDEPEPAACPIRVYRGELDWNQIIDVVEGLAAFGIPVLLFSGGEPMIHRGFYDLAEASKAAGPRLTLSTNGTLIDAEVARRLREIGFADVGISLDGIGATHDDFRGETGVFDKAVAAFGHCKAAGQKVGPRLTLSRPTVNDVEGILDFIKAEGIDRVCINHLIYSAGGADLALLRPEETRCALSTIMDRVEDRHRRGLTKEVLTVDQPRPVHGKCERCPDFRWCGGGCRGRAWQRFGDP